MERYKIDTVFHFAAQSHVDLSFGNSYSFTYTNVYGTHVMLESAKKCGIKRFIHISTDEVYGEVMDDDDDLVESSILAPTNPYAASKAAAEMMVHSYQKSFKLPVIIVRSNNVYGPHQFPESKFYPKRKEAGPLTKTLRSCAARGWIDFTSALKVKTRLIVCIEIIPKFTCLLNRGKPLVLHGDGSPTRRYLFAGDAADAFDTILHKGELGHIYNVGSYDEVANIDVCGKLLTEMGIPHDTPEEFRKWVKYTHDRPFNDHRYAVDGTKLRNLGWEQKTSFAEGLKITVDWYKRFGEKWWGDISQVLTPFPIVSGLKVVPDNDETITDSPQVDASALKKRKVDGTSVTSTSA